MRVMSYFHNSDNNMNHHGRADGRKNNVRIQLVPPTFSSDDKQENMMQNYSSNYNMKKFRARGCRGGKRVNGMKKDKERKLKQIEDAIIVTNPNTRHSYVHHGHDPFIVPPKDGHEHTVSLVDESYDFLSSSIISLITDDDEDVSFDTSGHISRRRTSSCSSTSTFTFDHTTSTRDEDNHPILLIGHHMSVDCKKTTRHPSYSVDGTHFGNNYKSSTPRMTVDTFSQSNNSSYFSISPNSFLLGGAA